MNEYWQEISEECKELGFKFYVDQMIKINKHATLRFISLILSEEVIELISQESEHSDLEIININEYVAQIIFEKLKLKDNQVDAFNSFVTLIVKKSILNKIENMRDPKQNQLFLERNIRIINVLQDYYNVNMPELNNNKEFLKKQNNKKSNIVISNREQVSGISEIEEGAAFNRNKLEGPEKTITIKINDEIIKSLILNKLKPFIDESIEILFLTSALDGKKVDGFIKIKKPSSTIIDLFHHYHSSKKISVASDKDMISWICENLQYWNSKSKTFKSINRSNIHQYFYGDRETSKGNRLR